MVERVLNRLKLFIVVGINKDVGFVDNKISKPGITGRNTSIVQSLNGFLLGISMKIELYSRGQKNI